MVEGGSKVAVVDETGDVGFVVMPEDSSGDRHGCGALPALLVHNNRTPRGTSR